MIWKEKEVEELVLSFIQITVNPCSHRESCCKACFWYTQTKKRALNTPSQPFKDIRVFVCQWLCGKMLDVQLTKQEQVGRSRARLHCGIIHLTETISCSTLYLTFSVHVCVCVLLFIFSSIRTLKLPFRQQKYDIWSSNDLQTISGNVHHESWKCIFPFPLWRRLHAHRKIYTTVVFSLPSSPSVSDPPSVLRWQFSPSHSFSSSSHVLFPLFWHLRFAKKKPP